MSELRQDAGIYRDSAKAVLELLAESLDGGENISENPKEIASVVYAAAHLLECAAIAEEEASESKACTCRAG